MARLVRIVVSGVAHPVTENGRLRQHVFFGEGADAEWRVRRAFNETIRAEFSAVGLKLAWDKQAAKL